MRNRLITSILAFAVALPLASALSFASIFGGHKSNEKSINLTLASTSKVPNGTELAPGSYRVMVPENAQKPEVVFYREGKEVAHAQAKLVAESQKNPATEVYTNTKGKDQVITEIRPAGMSERLVFSGSGK